MANGDEKEGKKQQGVPTVGFILLTAGLVLFGVALFPFVVAPSSLAAGILMAGVLSSVIGALTLKKHDRCSQPEAKQEAKTICPRTETQEQNITPDARSQQKYTDIVGKPGTPNQGRS
jgi:hypothetical protein